MVARRASEEFRQVGVAPPIDPGLWPEGVARQSALRFEELSDELTLVYEELRLVSSPNVAELANDLLYAMGELGSEARSGHGEAAEAFEAVRAQVHQARSRLRLAMRAELGQAD